MKFLLDTNIISEISKRDRGHPNIARWIARIPAEEIGTSVMVLAEMRRGIELKRRSDPQKAKSLDRWFARVRTRLGDRVLRSTSRSRKFGRCSEFPIPCR